MPAISAGLPHSKSKVEEQKRVSKRSSRKRGIEILKQKAGLSIKVWGDIHTCTGTREATHQLLQTSVFPEVQHEK